MRKIPAALLSLALTASLTAPLASAAGTGSTLPELDGHWSQSAFERWHAYGIVEGDSRGMRPDANMTVGEFAAILSRAMGYTETVENPYADLKGTEWYAPYILQLTAAGILQGDGTNCNAEEPMNRERATVLFARALGIRPTAQPDLSGFVDGKDAADWSAGYIDAMAKDGIIQGVGNQTLALGSSITRGSVVKILDSSVAEYAVEEGATIDQDVDGILLVSPYYNKATQKGLYRHFKTVADSVKVPAILYNVPSRTGCNILPETAVKLCKDVENIVGIKEASGNISQIAHLAAIGQGVVDIYSGNDDQIVPILSLGGIGVISVLSNVAPTQTHEICQKFFDGDVAGSRQMQLDAMDLCNALFCEVNPIPVKTALNMMGMGAGAFRMPLCEMDEANAKRLEKALKDYGVL